MGMKLNESSHEYIKRMRWLKIRFFLYAILGKQVHFLKKHDILSYCGEKVLFKPLTLPRNPKLIKLHNNVKIAANVVFYEHDIINSVFMHIDKNKGGNWKLHQSAIEIFDNSFVGGSSILIGPLKIGPNAIVAAGSVVVSDVPEGKIVAGNPAKVVGDFYSLYKKRLTTDYSENDSQYVLPDDKIWEQFMVR